MIEHAPECPRAQFWDAGEMEAPCTCGEVSEIKQRQVDGPGLDWDNDDLFFTYEWEDETTMFDPRGRWVGGGEYYAITLKARVPKAFEGCEEAIQWFIDWMVDDWPECNGFWRS